jgi:hypothetical protein
LLALPSSVLDGCGGGVAASEDTTANVSRETTATATAILSMVLPSSLRFRSRIHHPSARAHGQRAQLRAREEFGKNRNALARQVLRST